MPHTSAHAFFTDEERARRFVINQALDEWEDPSEPAVQVYGSQIQETTRETSQSPSIERISKYRNSSHPLAVDESPFSRQSFQISFSPVRYTYEESDLKQDGILWAVQGAYTVRISENQAIRGAGDIFSATNRMNMFRVEAMLAMGDVDVESASVGSSSGRENKIFDIRGVAGYDIPLSERSLVTPYWGVGYRTDADNSPGRILPFSSFTAGEFLRTSSRLYVPIGIEGQTALNPNWSLNANLEYNWVLWGRLDHNYGDMGVTVNSTHVLDDQQYTQDDGFGISGAVELIREGERLDFFVEPFFRYWKIAESNDLQFSSNSGNILWFDGSGTVPRTYKQPETETTEVGVKIGVKY